MLCQPFIVLFDIKANQQRNGFSLANPRLFLIGKYETNKSNKLDFAEELNEWSNSFLDQKINHWPIFNQFYLTHLGTLGSL